MEKSLLVERPRVTGSSLLRSGARWTMTTYARSRSSGTALKNSRSASTAPADAPIPHTGTRGAGADEDAVNVGTRPNLMRRCAVDREPALARSPRYYAIDMDTRGTDGAPLHASRLLGRAPEHEGDRLHPEWLPHDRAVRRVETQAMESVP
jgi:hypothetical protein